MTTQFKKSRQIFPDIPRGQAIVTPQDHLTPVWHQSLTQLYQALQKNFSNEGLQLPQLSSTDIANIQAIYQPFVTPANKVLPSNIPNISGVKVFNYSQEKEQTFIINFTIQGDATSPIMAAAWKTVTLT